MTSAVPSAATVVLAHHSLIAALPFALPTLVITLTVVVMAVRDRRRGDEDSDGEPVQGSD
ncbi:MAG: hypothetical protein ACRDRV_07460 [Pseudonocardiaceae bacterium]